MILILYCIKKLKTITKIILSSWRLTGNRLKNKGKCDTASSQGILGIWPTFTPSHALSIKSPFDLKHLVYDPLNLTMRISEFTQKSKDWTSRLCFFSASDFFTDFLSKQVLWVVIDSENRLSSYLRSTLSNPLRICICCMLNNWQLFFTSWFSSTGVYIKEKTWQLIPDIPNNLHQCKVEFTTNIPKTYSSSSHCHRRAIILSNCWMLLLMLFVSIISKLLLNCPIDPEGNSVSLMHNESLQSVQKKYMENLII